jgi:hypothetical protein
VTSLAFHHEEVLVGGAIQPVSGAEQRAHAGIATTWTLGV